MTFSQTEDATQDIEEALLWSAEHFGRAAARRYRSLIATAILEIVANPDLAGSRNVHGLPCGIKIYHIRHSKTRAAVDGLIVKRPRHFIAYRLLDSQMVEIVRVLHDSMDIESPFV
ncbi:MAG: type II toxin-antitoxin system RelE/ParE family toxin [Verrucomicrobiota bacterium]